MWNVHILVRKIVIRGVKTKNETQNAFSIFLIIEDFKLINFGRVDLVTQWSKLLQICFYESSDVKPWSRRYFRSILHSVHKMAWNHFYIILFFESGNLFASRFLFIELFQLIDIVPKNLNSTDQLSSTIWFRLNRMKDWSEISTPPWFNVWTFITNKSEMRFTLKFSFWTIESQSFGLKYGHFIYHQLRKCPNSKNSS